jgi:hypothetical protein
MSDKTMEITTMIGCPLMCTYCPQDALRDAYGTEDVKYMSLETFKTAVDKLPWDCRLDFSGMAEPWVNPACTDMLEYALKNDRQVAIFTTLYNWDEDTVHRVGALLLEHANQVDIFKIHFPDEAGNMKGWKPSEEWEYAYIGMREIVQAAGIHYEAMTMSDHGVHPGIRHLPGVGVSHSWSIAAHDRAGTLDKDKVKEQPILFITEHKKPVVCGKTSLYDQNVLLPNGDVVLCCMDYDNKHIIGNLVTQKYEDLFTGPEFTKLLAMNAEPCYNSGSLCKSCTDAKVI